MSRSLCPGLDPRSPEKRLKRVTRTNFYFFTCGCGGSGALSQLGMGAGAGVTGARLCLWRCILPHGEREGDPKGAHQSSWVMQTPTPLGCTLIREKKSTGPISHSIPGNSPGHSGWREGRLCCRESLQTHGHVCTSNCHRRSSWTQKRLSALDEVKAQNAISCDSPGIDLALRRRQGGKVESVSLRGP